MTIFKKKIKSPRYIQHNQDTYNILGKPSKKLFASLISANTKMQNVSAFFFTYTPGLSF